MSAKTTLINPASTMQELQKSIIGLENCDSEETPSKTAYQGSSGRIDLSEERKFTEYDSLHDGLAILDEDETGASTSKGSLDAKAEDDTQKTLDYDALYDQVKRRVLERFFSSPYQEKDVQHPSLLPTLRPYQSKAVNWMISQELHSDIKGGILADEMGLGKTVEFLALILNRPRENLVYPEYLKHETKAVELITIKEEIIDDDIEESPNKKAKIEDSSCPKCSPEVSEINNENLQLNLGISIKQEPDEICEILPLEESKRKKATPKCTCKPLTLKERLTITYNNTLAEYSCLARSDSAKEKEETDDPRILCICGRRQKTNEPLVECQECKRLQHVACIKYDLNDPERGCYFCPECWPILDPVESKATLIISPSSITTQWLDEIRNHLDDDLNVLLYQGVNGGQYYQPLHLARKYDLIIVSYDTLRKELCYVEAKSVGERRFRRAPSYLVRRSPLVSIQFWRVCLDEAQMVEGSQTAGAKMARKLHAVHRWCVTGTPIQKSIHDLYGLFLFLGVQAPKSLLYDTTALTEVLASFFWRTRKSHVADQIHVPEQKEFTYSLVFSPVEQHFYEEQQKLCLSDFSKQLEKFHRDDQAKLSSLDPHTFNRLLQPLLRLRQACVHPQMVRGLSLTMRIQTKTMSMEDLLLSLIKKAQVECEESHRLRVAAANGLAALHAIKEEWALAAGQYRDVLRWSDELKNSIKTDTLQLLHTMHNLADILSTAPAGTVPPTLRDSYLLTEAQQLRNHYLERVSAQVEAARSALAPLTGKVAALSGELDSNIASLNDFWWNAVINWATYSGLSEKLIKEIKDKLSEEAVNAGASSTFGEFRTLDGLVYSLVQRLEKMVEQRTKVGNLMRILEITSTEQLANDAADCHLRPLERRKRGINRCQLCKTHDDIEDYETLLFRMEDRRKDQEDDWKSDEEEGLASLEAPRRGTWADSEAERVLKLLLQFARRNYAPSVAVDGGTIHLKLLNAYKTEFRNIRIVWRHLNDQASAVDELSMATIRLRLRLPYELPQAKPSNKFLNNDSNKPTPIYLLEKHEIDIQRSKLQGDFLSASNSLQRNMGRVAYLKNLEKAGYGKTGSQNLDLCPACTMEMGYQWSALPCGHCFCINCTPSLLMLNKGKTFKCLVCRAEMPMSEISHVDARPGGEAPLDEIPVKGSYSTKIEAVVRKLLAIKAEDPAAKCLIFSEWRDVFKIVVEALDENGIGHCSLVTGQDKKRQLNKFKSDPSVMALLLPIRTGANGLNLIEATHIIFVEPIMNPGEELQAIGRIHRIGQTKPTFVHRFLVRDTIEEKMGAMLETHRSALSSCSARSIRENPVTVADLKSLLPSEQPFNIESDI